jgi:alanine dehydrogenase
MEQKLFSEDTVRSNLDARETITAVKKAFKSFALGDAQMPAKSYLTFDEYHGDLRSMPAYLPDFDRATVKVVNAHPENPGRHGLPTVMALILAVDPRTGFPEAILDGTAVTSRRTAAASAIATERFTHRDVDRLGMIGTGAQARDQLHSHMVVRNFSELWIADRSEEALKNFEEWVNETYPSLDVTQTESSRAILQNCPVIVSLTPSTSPLVNDADSLPEPQHINAMGADAPSKQEWPEEVLRESDLIVDNWDQARHSGEISQWVEAGSLTREDLAGEIGNFLLVPERTTGQRTLFDSTGLAIQDTAAAHVLLEQNVKPDGTFSFFSEGKTA